MARLARQHGSHRDGPAPTTSASPATRASTTWRCGWRPGADAQQRCGEAIRALGAEPPAAQRQRCWNSRSAGQIRATSLRIFDRSFAVTYWLQAVAIGIGLFGVAASFSAQVLARRKEFGLLAHLGLTRRQILARGGAGGRGLDRVGALAGLALGLAVSRGAGACGQPAKLSLDHGLLLPWGRLLALCAAVVLAGTLTAWLAGRAAAGRDAVLAVKEDW